jgi:hypothetical protein
MQFIQRLMDRERTRHQSTMQLRHTRDHEHTSAPSAQPARSVRAADGLNEAVRLTWRSRLLLSTAMIRRRDAVLVVLMSIAALSASCADNPVGRICDIGTATPQATDIVVASPSLDCVSRTCLRVPSLRPSPPSQPPGGNNGLCTAECSADSDCDRVPESPCTTGFTCGIAVTVGPFCCRKFCICKDYIVVPESGELATPKACEASDKANECCNLDGRANSPDYAACKT